MTIAPTDMDVLCGKDKGCLQAKGSRRFRDIVDSYLPQYTSCKTKLEKMTVTKTIYEVVSKDARFLKFNEAKQVWEEISVMAARDKIGHSLRFSSRAKRRHNKMKKNPQHKRSGSTSSASSSGSDNSNPFAQDTLVGLLQPSEPALSTPTVEEEREDEAHHQRPRKTPRILMTRLVPDRMLTAPSIPSPESFIMKNNNTKIQSYVEPLIASDPLDNSMDDIMNVVKSIEEKAIVQPVSSYYTEEDSLLSLLSEPVGEWDDVRSVEK